MLNRFVPLALYFAVACNLIPTATPAVLPRTPAPVDDLELYRSTLTTAAQADLMQLDRPTRYTMTLTYDADTAKLSGSQDVIFWNRQTAPLSEIYFRLFANYPQSGGQIVVSQVTVNGASVTPSLQVKDTVLRVPLAQPLAPNASYTYRIGQNIQ